MNDPWLLGLALTVGVLAGSVGATIAIAIIIGSGKKGSASEDAFEFGYVRGMQDAQLAGARANLEARKRDTAPSIVDEQTRGDAT